MTANLQGLTRLEHHLGWLLMAGVVLSAVLLAAGLVLWLAYPDEAPALWLLNGGLVVLIATPIMRVILSLAEFVRLRDWFFVATTMAVLIELAVTVIVALARR